MLVKMGMCKTLGLHFTHIYFMLSVYAPRQKLAGTITQDDTVDNKQIEKLNILNLLQKVVLNSMQKWSCTLALHPHLMSLLI